MSELSGFDRFRSRIDRWGFETIMSPAWVRRWLAGPRREPLDGRILDESLAAMLRLDDITGHSDLRKLPPAKARHQVAYDITLVQSVPPPGVTASDHEVPGPAGPIPLRLYAKEGLPAPAPAVFIIHGGGWVTGSIATHDGWCRRLASGADVRVASIDYRLAPEHRFPAAVQDCLAAFRWIASHASELGIDPDTVAVAGDSAGGNLAAVIARLAEGDDHPPALQVLLYPALDGTCSLPSYETFAERFFLTRPMCDWYYDHYVGDGDRAHPDVSPLLSASVPRVRALVYPVGFDPLRDEAIAYAGRLEGAGAKVLLHEFQDLIHGFIFHGTASEAARKAGDQVISDIRAALRR